MKRSMRGQTLIEFALILPVFLILLLGGLDVGWFLYQAHIQSSVTAEGAECVSKNPSCDVDAFVTNQSQGLGLRPVTFNVSYSGGIVRTVGIYKFTNWLGTVTVTRTASTF